MVERIEPRVLKGFRDILPSEELLKRDIARNLEATFGSFGFVPIDTPVLEYADILLGKGGGETDKQVYRFSDHGERDVAMRFDLTVPFARFMAMYEHEIPLPFKRYHIAKVWRGENTQRGRYREFIQCDFDIVGTDHAAADSEILVLMYRTLERLGVPGFKIRLAHRGLFNRFLSRIGAADRSVEVLRVVDKLAKIGDAGVREQLSGIVSTACVDSIVDYITPENDFDTTLRKITSLAGEECAETIRLREVYSVLDHLGISGSFHLDPSITRGLDYYTGIVYETFLTGLEEYGSICSGGRYNNLASLYTSRELPGVGASIGLDRLMAALSEANCFERPDPVPQVSVFNLDDTLVGHYFSIADRVRSAGYSCEVHFEKRKIAQQFARAEKLGTVVAVICGGSEFASETVNLKHLESRESYDGLSLDAAIDVIRRLIG